jgi:hypothetical protein
MVTRIRIEKALRFGSFKIHFMELASEEESNWEIVDPHSLVVVEPNPLVLFS